MKDRPLPIKAKPSDEVLFQQMNDEAVLLNMTSEHYFGLNSIGMRIWELISQDDSVNNVFTALLKEYNVEEEMLKADLTDILCALEDDQLVTLEY